MSDEQIAPRDRDPGGIFPSDLHRRVLAHLPTPDDDPITGPALIVRLDGDAETPIGVRTPEQMQASIPRMDDTLAALVEAGDAEQVTEGEWRMTVAGFERLTGPIADEPPPLEGARLKAALVLDDELAKEDAAAAKAAAADRIERAKGELADAEKAAVGAGK